MTRAAAIRGIRMGRAPAGRFGAVVAGHAGADHLCMVNLNCRLPRRCGMARIAGVGRQNMCRGLAGGRCAVVARRTCTKYFRMVDLVRSDGLPRRRRMACGAIVGRIDVPGRTRVTARARAAANDLCVIHL